MRDDWRDPLPFLRLLIGLSAGAIALIMSQATAARDLDLSTRLEIVVSLVLMLVALGAAIFSTIFFMDGAREEGDEQLKSFRQGWRAFNWSLGTFSAGFTLAAFVAVEIISS